MEHIPVNFKLLGNPINWFIVILTLLIGSFAVNEILPKISNNI